MLDTLLSLLELADALDTIKKNACPRADGLTKVFYEIYWEWIAPMLLEGLQEIWDSEELPKEFSEGKVYLIPKSKRETYVIQH